MIIDKKLNFTDEFHYIQCEPLISRYRGRLFNTSCICWFTWLVTEVPYTLQQSRGLLSMRCVTFYFQYSECVTSYSTLSICSFDLPIRLWLYFRFSVAVHVVSLSFLRFRCFAVVAK